MWGQHSALKDVCTCVCGQGYVFSRNLRSRTTCLSPASESLSPSSRGLSGHIFFREGPKTWSSGARPPVTLRLLGSRASSLLGPNTSSAAADPFLLVLVALSLTVLSFLACWRATRSQRSGSRHFLSFLFRGLMMLFDSGWGDNGQMRGRKGGRTRQEAASYYGHSHCPSTR